MTTEAPVLEVRRRTALVAGLGVGASLVAVAYLARAAAGGSLLDWLLGGVLAVVGILNLAALVDSRSPLLVADELGVRLRLGRSWVGLPWGGVHDVELRPRERWWRDGRLTVHTHYVQRVLEDLDPGARRLARLNRRLHRDPLAVPLGLGTRVVGAEPDLLAALRALADGRTPVSEPEPTPPRLRVPRLPDPRPALAHVIGVVAARFERPERSQPAAPPELPEVPVVPAPEPVVVLASATPPPSRETLAARRTEVRHESHGDIDDTHAGDLPAQPVLEVEPLPEPVLEPVLEPVPDPVIGPRFAAARRQLGLSVDALADRTRIRPHVIEAIEVDDFGACGGDFYARGHLRTLARVLGVEVAPILATYDEEYADAPIDPRRVFEAELAGAGSIRATRGGPNWSVLVAAVMALVLCWSVARLVTGGPGHSPDVALLTGSGGVHHSRSVLTPPVPVTLTAAGGGARVVVRDGLGKLVFSGDLSYGQQHTVRASAPVHVQSSDGSVQVTVDGKDRGRMGPAGRPAAHTYRYQ